MALCTACAACGAGVSDFGHTALESFCITVAMVSGAAAAHGAVHCVRCLRRRGEQSLEQHGSLLHMLH